jgi:hypothetical protein
MIGFVSACKPVIAMIIKAIAGAARLMAFVG